MNEENTHFLGVHFLGSIESIMLSVKQLDLSTNKSCATIAEFFGLIRVYTTKLFMYIGRHKIE